MKGFDYLIQNFFTHKDFLAPADQIPGTLFTPLQFIFSGILLVLIIGAVIYVSKHRNLIKPVFTGLWIMLVIFEVVIVSWESVSGREIYFDLKTNLSLYPCSIFMYALPFAIWGKGLVKQSACGYVCTLGLLGAMVNFVYPVGRLTTYSCISFIGLHTYTYHSSMLFVALVMLVTKYHTYTHVTNWYELFLPCIPSVLLSIPANILNYSSLDSDYMYFTGDLPLVRSIFGNAPDYIITIVLYGLYIFIPVLFYLPSYIRNKVKARKTLSVS